MRTGGSLTIVSIGLVLPIIATGTLGDKAGSVIQNLGIGGLVTAYGGIFAEFGYSQVIELMQSTPEAIINFLGKSKYAAPLRIAAKASPDAFRAALIYASQDDRFQQFIIDGVMGDGAFEKANGTSENDATLDDLEKALDALENDQPEN